MTSGTHAAAGIELHGVTKRFVTPSGSAFTALRDVDLVIEPGQFCAVVGPTGCGKSTTLSLVSGLTGRAPAPSVSAGVPSTGSRQGRASCSRPMP